MQKGSRYDSTKHSFFSVLSYEMGKETKTFITDSLGFAKCAEKNAPAIPIHMIPGPPYRKSGNRAPAAIYANAGARSFTPKYGETFAFAFASESALTLKSRFYKAGLGFAHVGEHVSFCRSLASPRASIFGTFLRSKLKYSFIVRLSTLQSYFSLAP